MPFITTINYFTIEKQTTSSIQAPQAVTRTRPILPEIEAFIRATVKNHEELVKENGNLRFDVLQKADDPSEFALYEASESEEHAAAHKHTPHYLEWRETLAEWMAQPQGRGPVPGYQTLILSSCP